MQHHSPTLKLNIMKKFGEFESSIIVNNVNEIPFAFPTMAALKRDYNDLRPQFPELPKFRKICITGHQVSDIDTNTPNEITIYHLYKFYYITK